MATLRYLLLAALCLCTTYTYGQDSVANKNNKSNLYTWALKLPLLNPFDLSSPNLAIGIERRLDEHNGLQIVAGPSVSPLNFKLNGYRLKGEYRRYFHVRTHFSFFLAGELFYTQYRVSDNDSFIDQHTGAGYRDNYYVLRQSYGANGKSFQHSGIRSLEFT